MPRRAISIIPGPSNASRSSTSHGTDVAPQSQEAPLTMDAVAKINDLKNANQKVLQDRITAALEHIINATDLINNRGYEERTKYNNRKRKAGEDVDQTPSDDQQRYEQLQEKIELTTKKLDVGIRQIIDDRAWLENIPDALDHVGAKSTAISNRATRATQATREDDELDGDHEGADNDLPIVQPDPSENPSALLHAALSTHDIAWKSKSLTQRYALDNDYKGYKRLVWETNHQGDNPPPMPHYSLWFAAEEGREAKATQRQRQQTQRPSQTSTQNMIDLQSPSPSTSNPDSDSEVEIQSETTRITCPITLLPFTDPVTSTKCPHSYEKKAIESMLAQSKSYVPLTPQQQATLTAQPNQQSRSKLERQFRTPTVQCPECIMQITTRDLRPDAALLRKVKRILEKRRREEESELRHDNEVMDMDDENEDEDPDDLPRLSQRPRRNIVTIASSPARSLPGSSAEKTVKDEHRIAARDSVVPQTQLDENGSGNESVDEKMYD